MSTAHEFNARMAQAVKDIDSRVQSMTERVNAMTARINREAILAKMVEGYKNGEPIWYYKWNYEYSFQPGRRCLTSDNLLLPGKKAYKGTLDESSNGDSATFFMRPKEIWLSKEEFTMRRLKGLV